MSCCKAINVFDYMVLPQTLLGVLSSEQSWVLGYIWSQYFDIKILWKYSCILQLM